MCLAKRRKQISFSNFLLSLSHTHTKRFKLYATDPKRTKLWNKVPNKLWQNKKKIKTKTKQTITYKPIRSPSLGKNEHLKVKTHLVHTCSRENKTAKERIKRQTEDRERSNTGWFTVKKMRNNCKMKQNFIWQYVCRVVDRWSWMPFPNNNIKQIKHE